MKILRLLTASLMLLPLALPAQPAPKQTVTGDWQATLEGGQAKDSPGGKIRIIMRINGTDTLSAKLFNADQAVDAGQTTSTLSFQDGTLKFYVPSLSTNYQGKLSADGNTLNGTWIWTQNGVAPIPLIFVRATKDTAWQLPEAPKPPMLMAADADPSFDVATIKPSKETDSSHEKNLNVNGRNFTTGNLTLTDLLAFTYGIHPKQIVDHPAWMDSDKFDIHAVPDAEGEPSEDQWKSMLKKFMASRFGLKFHHDKRELAVYTITVARTPPNLAPSASTNVLPNTNFRPAPNGLTISSSNSKITDLTEFLQVLVLDRPVVDKTGLTGRYNFQFTFTPDGSQFSAFGGHAPIKFPTDTPDPAPSMFTAIQEQLGLKLTSVKEPADVIVIDHVEHPSEN